MLKVKVTLVKIMQQKMNKKIPALINAQIVYEPDKRVIGVQFLLNQIGHIILSSFLLH